MHDNVYYVKLIAAFQAIARLLPDVHRAGNGLFVAAAWEPRTMIN
jgi:hypothetical protein